MHCSTVLVGPQELIGGARCEEVGCLKQSTLGYPGASRVRCAAHRLEGMVGAL